MHDKKPSYRNRRLGGRGVLRGLHPKGVAEEAKTGGCATPALAGCAFVVTDVSAGNATLQAGTWLVKKVQA
jgi:hypothetical protein